MEKAKLDYDTKPAMSVYELIRQELAKHDLRLYYQRGVFLVMPLDKEIVLAQLATSGEVIAFALGIKFRKEQPITPIDVK